MSAPLLRMHAALLRAGRLVARWQASDLYRELGSVHVTSAIELADLATELHTLGYLEEKPERPGKTRKKKRTAHHAATV